MELYPVDILIHIINIVVLFVLLRIILLKPLMNFLEARRAKIDAEFKRADKVNAEALESKKAFEEQLSDADNRSREILRAGETKASAEAQRIIAEAQVQAQAIISDAKQKAEQEKERAEIEMRDDIVRLSLQMAGAVLKREVSLADNRAVAEEFFKENTGK